MFLAYVQPQGRVIGVYLLRVQSNADSSHARLFSYLLISILLSREEGVPSATVLDLKSVEPEAWLRTHCVYEGGSKSCDCIRR